MQSEVKDVTFRSDPEGIECENYGKMTFNLCRGCPPNASTTHPGLHPGLLKFDRSAVNDERLDSRQLLPKRQFHYFCRC
jgi:hypothetical protein